MGQRAGQVVPPHSVGYSSGSLALSLDPPGLTAHGLPAYLEHTPFITYLPRNPRSRVALTCKADSKWAQIEARLVPSRPGTVGSTLASIPIYYLINRSTRVL